MANALGELFGDIASAIREKTGDAEKMKPAQFPEKISEIETGADVSGVTATAEDVLNGKKFVDAGGNVIDGTMPNLGSKIIWWRNRPIRNTEAINQGGIAILEIEEGYHDGTSGIQLTFEYPKRYTPTKERKRFSSSYSTGMFLGDIDIDPIPDQYQDVTPVTATAEDVRAGKVFVDAEGNAVEGALSGTIADVSGVTATAANVLQGKTIVDADGNEVEGSIPVVETSEVELSVQTPSGAIPVGYYANGVALSVAAKSAAVTPTKETQNLADSFYDSITVDPIPEEYQNVSGVTATAEDVVEGKVIVDAQGNEVVGTLVPGGGGGSLQAGLYWETLDVKYPNKFTQRWVKFKGNIYAFTLDVAGSGNTRYIYKLVNGNWALLHDAGANGFTTTASALNIIEYNGKLHLVGTLNRHHAFDGSTLTTLNTLPNSGSMQCLFVQDGLLKMYCSADGNIYKWNESSDTWTSEGRISTGSYYFLNVNNDIYVINSKNVYTYKNGVLTSVGTLSNNSNARVAVGNKIYYSVSSGYSTFSDPLWVYDPVTNTDRKIGNFPGGGVKNNVVAIYDEKLAVFNNGGVYPATQVAHEVTE